MRGKDRRKYAGKNHKFPKGMTDIERMAARKEAAEQNMPTYPPSFRQLPKQFQNAFLRTLSKQDPLISKIRETSTVGDMWAVLGANEEVKRDFERQRINFNQPISKLNRNQREKALSLLLKQYEEKIDDPLKRKSFEQMMRKKLGV